MSTLSINPKRSRAEQARINGAKSRGPVTPEGKARSALNNLKHGAYASPNTVLANEDPVAYDLSLQACIRRFRPADPFEHNLVRDICNTDWLINRNRATEASLINSELLAQQLPPELRDSPCPEPELTAQAVDSLLGRSRTLAHVQRQIHQLIITRQRLLKTLLDARRHFPVQERSADLDLPLASEPLPDPAPEPPSTERTRQPVPESAPAAPSTLRTCLIPLPSAPLTPPPSPEGAS